MQTIQFFVKGEPRPKQSFRSTGHGRGYTHPRVKAWQTEVAVEAQNAMRAAGLFNEPLDRDLFVELVFTLGDHRRVDLDNLSKTVLDGMNGVVWTDDRVIIDLHLRKRITTNPEETGVSVRVDVAVEMVDIGDGMKVHPAILAAVLDSADDEEVNPWILDADESARFVRMMNSR